MRRRRSATLLTIAATTVLAAADIAIVNGWNPFERRLSLVDAALIAPIDASLIAAVRAGDSAQVRVALDRGANPNVRDSNGDPVITLAAQAPISSVVYGMLTTGGCQRYEHHKGFKETVAELIRHGANPNVMDHKGFTPLQYAARFDEGGAYTLLQRAGAVK